MNIPLYVYTMFVYSFICWWTLGCFHLSAIVNNTAMKYEKASSLFCSLKSLSLEFICFCIPSSFILKFLKLLNTITFFSLFKFLCSFLVSFLMSLSTLQHSKVTLLSVCGPVFLADFHCLVGMQLFSFFPFLKIRTLYGIWPQYLSYCSHLCDLVCLKFYQKGFASDNLYNFQSSMFCCFLVLSKNNGMSENTASFWDYSVTLCHFYLDLLFPCLRVPVLLIIDSNPRSFSSLWDPVLQGCLGKSALQIHRARMF